MNPKIRKLFPVEVIQIRDVTPAMRRITVAGDELRNLHVDKPAQWMKVFFPSSNDMGQVGRAYTIRRFDAVAGIMDIDFVMHGDNGPASSWVARARLGEILHLAGPRSGYVSELNACKYVLIGDATALPAIASIAATLPKTAQVETYIEVANEREEQILETAADLRSHWFHAGDAIPGTVGQLEKAILAAKFDPGDCQFWLGGESSMVRTLQKHLLFDHQIPRQAIQSAGYWKLGAADHRERN